MFNASNQQRPLGSLHVAELAQRADVTPATVRYYARIGLLNPDREPENGYRCFSAGDLRRISFIRKAQALGLTIGDIKFILDTADKGEMPCHEVKSLVNERLATIRARIVMLRRTEDRIRQAMHAWEAMENDSDTRIDGEICPLIERLVVCNNNWLPT
jgi:MerR family Zn(II)-responsive transcriptional regulator of zntA